MSLSRLETSQSTPPFYNYIFYCPSFWERSALTRSKCENSILGNGFIHLNIAEIHEGDIGGLKTYAYFGNQGSKSANWIIVPIKVVKFVKLFDVLPEPLKS